jgi:hypothetical protein
MGSNRVPIGFRVRIPASALVNTRCSRKRRSWVVCVRNDGYESGEDYLFPARYFASIELPAAVRGALAAQLAAAAAERWRGRANIQLVPGQKSGTITK